MPIRSFAGLFKFCRISGYCFALLFSFNLKLTTFQAKVTHKNTCIKQKCRSDGTELYKQCFTSVLSPELCLERPSSSESPKNPKTRKPQPLSKFKYLHLVMI